MKKYIAYIIFCINLLCISQISASSGLVSFAKTIGSASFWTGMGPTFGASPVGYTYSFEAISDANDDVYVALEGMASFMGGAFPSPKGLYDNDMLPSIFSATTGPSIKSVHHDKIYFFNLYFSKNSDVRQSPIYSQAFLQLPFQKNDPNIYYYHVYTGKHYDHGRIVHEPKVESMGFANPKAKGDDKGSVDIGGQLTSVIFYNSSSNDVQVRLNYGGTPYIFTLEKYSYNTLNAQTKTDADVTTPLFSLRPNTLSFSTYNATSKKYEKLKDLNLPSDGFNGCNYTIEIFDEGQSANVCIQGLLAGNYDQMISTKVRDITPCSCFFWYESVAQSPVGDGFIDLPGQVWVAYQGADSLIVSKVSTGSVISWNLVRPLLSIGNEYVYFVYVATDDDLKGKKFVEQVVQNSLGKDQVAQYKLMIQDPAAAKASVQKLQATAATKKGEQQSSTLTGSLASSMGIIQDKDQDVYGYIIGMDVFTPKGLGNGNFYYVLSPLVVNTGNLVQLVSGCIDTSKLSGSSTDAQKLLNQTVISWLQGYLKNPADIARQVQDFIIKNGNTMTLNAAGGLTQYGKNQLNLILQGPMSLKYPPMKLSTVTNQYVYDFGKSKPDKMPSVIIPVAPVTEL